MDRRKLVSEIADEAKVERKTVDAVLRALQGTLKTVEAKGESVDIRDGVLKFSKRKPAKSGSVKDGPASARTVSTRVASPTKLINTLRAHGIRASDDELSTMFEDVLSSMPALDSGAMPTDEAALYDSAGFTASPKALESETVSTAARYAALISQAEPIQDAARNLDLTRPRVQQMITAREVWALRDARNRWVLPRIQFDADRLLPGWQVVARRIPPDCHPLTVLGLLQTPQPELVLDGKPVTIPTWLRSGGDARLAADITVTLDDVAL